MYIYIYYMHIEIALNYIINHYYTFESNLMGHDNEVNWHHELNFCLGPKPRLFYLQPCRNETYASHLGQVLYNHLNLETYNISEIS